ncbi:ATP-binding protein [Streptomyces sp. NPDC047813]|uniref:ATP-binding protein n=1 Tax=Streptomyces sp. NPDC047813 TaxID=3154608 RepID=UPI0033EEB1CE
MSLPRKRGLTEQAATTAVDQACRMQRLPTIRSQFPEIALGTEAAMAGFRVKYVLATKLVNELVEAADEKQLTKTIARYGRVDLLCIDELGYMELDRRGAELLFQVLTEREEKNSVAIASNESFSGWTKTFTDPRLCAAIVDRLTFGGNIVETGTDSYRLATTRARAEHQAIA